MRCEYCDSHHNGINECPRCGAPVDHKPVNNQYTYRGWVNPFDDYVRDAQSKMEDRRAEMFLAETCVVLDPGRTSAIKFTGVS
jgi:hypothetical protein